MKLLIMVLLLLFAVVAGIFLQQNPGTVAVNFGLWHVEMPTELLLGALLVLGLTLFFLKKIIIGLLRFIFTLPHILQKRRESISRNNTNSAMLHMLESKWNLAESQAIKGIDNSPMPLANYLTAAQAAWEQHAWDRCEKYLKLSEEVLGKPNITILLMKTQLLFQKKQYSECSVLLEKLAKKNSTNSFLLRLMADLYFVVEDWHKLAGVLPKLEKYGDYGRDKMQSIVDAAFCGILCGAENKTKRALIRIYNNIPKSYKRSPKIIAAYINCLIDNGYPAVASKVLVNAIEKSWDARLVEIYGKINLPGGLNKIKLAESWLLEHTNEPTLLLALARLCLKEKLWGKAREYFESCVKIKPNAEAFAELGQLCDKLGDLEQGRSYYQKGLFAVTARD